MGWIAIFFGLNAALAYNKGRRLAFGAALFLFGVFGGVELVILLFAVPLTDFYSFTFG